MTKLFQGKNGGMPFPRNATEWMEKGYSSEAATHKVRQDVFGHDYKVDARGKPIETGIGSAHQQTPQHRGALEKTAGARAAMRSKVGYSPALEGTFDPRAQAKIDELQAKIGQLTARKKSVRRPPPEGTFDPHSRSA